MMIDATEPVRVRTLAVQASCVGPVTNFVLLAISSLSESEMFRFGISSQGNLTVSDAWKFHLFIFSGN